MERQEFRRSLDQDYQRLRDEPELWEQYLAADMDPGARRSTAHIGDRRRVFDVADDGRVVRWQEEHLSRLTVRPLR